MAKKNSFWVCSNCGNEFTRWVGQCTYCKEWNTLVEQKILSDIKQGIKISETKAPMVLHDIEIKDLQRISSKFGEFDRVLGGNLEAKEAGIVPGSVVLISGDPGIGKSTLLVQVCANIVDAVDSVMYISAEESVEQIAMRVRRIQGKNKGYEKIKFANIFYVENIIEEIRSSGTKFAVIDSIQTISDGTVSGLPGGMAQVRSVSSKLVSFAKSENITLFIVGHINKEGEVAGPKILEHLVDAVIQIEGDKSTGLRIVRSMKNRYGTTNEVGILQMVEEGMEDVENPAQFFLSDDSAPGVCKSVIMEGNRPLIVEVQVLTNHTIFSLPKRIAEGVSVNRLQLICAILQKHLKLNLSDKDVYLNIAGGLRVMDRSLDLAIANAIISSVKNIGIDPKYVVFGEISLSGSINKSFNHDIKKKEAKRLGFASVASSENYKSVKDLLKHFS